MEFEEGLLQMKHIPEDDNNADLFSKESSRAYIWEACTNILWINKYDRQGKESKVTWMGVLWVENLVSIEAGEAATAIVCLKRVFGTACVKIKHTCSDNVVLTADVFGEDCMKNH